jgi:hypothetical protein
MAQYSAASSAVGYSLDNTAPTDISDSDGIYFSSGHPDRPRRQPSLLSERKYFFLRFAIGLLLCDYKLYTYIYNNNRNNARKKYRNENT